MKHLLQFFLVVCCLGPAVLSAQNIGIGTTTPADRLTVRSATGGLGISQETPDGTVRVGFYTTPAAGAYLQTHTNHDLQFATNNGLAQMVLQRGTGFVGIGIAAPLATLHLRGAGAERLRLDNSAALALNVRNDIVFRTGSFFTGQIRTVGTGTNAARLGFYTGAQASADEMSERLTIGDNGAVGIGTVTPQHPLTFNSVLGDKISFWGGTGSATVGHYGIGIANSALQLYSAGPNDDIVFGHGRSGAFVENVRMKGNGNVGIGTNNPTSRLTVFGNTSGFEHTNGTASLRTQLFSNNLLAIVGTTSNTSLSLQANNGSNGAEIRLTSNGDVGMGTVAPTAKLHVNGNVRVDGGIEVSGPFKAIGANASVFEFNPSSSDFIDPVISGEGFERVIINHPILNNNPNAILFIQPLAGTPINLYGQNYSPSYSTSLQKWTISCRHLRLFDAGVVSADACNIGGDCVTANRVGTRLSGMPDSARFYVLYFLL